MIRIPLCLLAIAAVGLAGCQNDDPDPQVTEATIDEGLDIGALGGIPADTRRIILDDLGGAQVSSYEILPTAEGTMYEVTYIENGQPKSKTYSSDGLVQVTPADRAQAAAATQPGNEVDPTDPIDPAGTTPPPTGGDVPPPTGGGDLPPPDQR